MDKVLTVIVPVYNMEKYIRQCLESLVIGEVLDRIEVLVVLEGSKDGSAEIAYEFVEQYPDTLRIIYKANGGHGSAINTGLMMASGEYVKILDSDDWVERDAFCRLVDCLETEGTEPARQAGRKIDENWMKKHRISSVWNTNQKQNWTMRNISKSITMIRM